MVGSSTAERVRRARRRARLTQVQVAELVGCRQATISAIECGKVRRPSYDLIVRLGMALRVKPERLVSFNDQEAA